MSPHGTLASLLFHSGPFATFLFMLVENLGVPFIPTELGYVASQRHVAGGRISFLGALAVLTAGHLIGSLISYWLGRRIARKAGAPGRASSRALAKLKGWYGHYGAPAVFIARFVGQVRPWSSYVAGTAEMPFLPFLSYSLAGIVLFNLIAMLLTDRILRYLDHHPLLRIVAGILFALGLVSAVLIETHERRKERVRPERY